MATLFLMNENFTNGQSDWILDILSALSILAAIFVITSKNPIISIFFLIGLFLSVALYLIFVGLIFLGLSYLIVYIGAVSILFLFILMLINIRVSELQSNNSNSILLGTIILMFFYSLFVRVLTPRNQKRFYFLTKIFSKIK
jgi:NADH-ubiquinone oxidoreductase chain 6